MRPHVGAAVGALLVALVAFAGANQAHNVVAADSAAAGTRRDPETRAAHARSLHNLDLVQASDVRVLHRSAKRSMAGAKQHQPFPDELDMELDAFGTTIHFSLTLNEHMFHPDARLFVDSTASPIEHRYYKGRAKSMLGEGWARLVVHDTDHGSALVTGGFAQDGEMYYIKTPQEFSLMQAQVSSRAPYDRRRAAEDDVRMVVYRSSDIEVHDPEAFMCGVTEEHQAMISHEVMPMGGSAAEIFHAADHGKRTTPSGCPTSLKVVYIWVVMDSNFVSFYGGADAAKTQTLNNFNLASTVYEEEFNIVLGVYNITTYTDTGTGYEWNQLCSSGPTITQRLSYFANWRGTQSTDPGLFHLQSTCATLPTIGIAWLNQLCQTNVFSQQSNGQTQYVSGVAISTVVDETWLVVAHEIGHNFGSVHDCVSSTCPMVNNICNPCGAGCNCNAEYIMNPSETGTATGFSEGSQNQMCSTVQTSGTCILPPGTYTVENTGVCGNGIREGTEQCDCGSIEECSTNACCYSNCTLKPGAACNKDLNTLCCLNCQLNTNTSTLCRAAANPDCDVAEYCDGKNFSCPPDTYADNLKPCNTVNLTALNNPDLQTTYRCASGMCTSRELQCYLRGEATGNSGYTQACAPFSGSCQMFCSSQFQSCTFFYATFIPGTPCGNGYCLANGQCSVPDLIGTIITFINANLVMVAIGAAMLGILILGFLIWGCQSAGRKEVDTRYGRMTRMQALQRTMTIRRGQQRGAPPPSNQPPRRPPPNRSPQPSGGNQRQPPPQQYASGAPPPYEPPAYELVPPTQNAQQPRMSNASAFSNARPSVDSSSRLMAGPSGAQHSSSPGRSVRCPICNKQFPTEAALNTHLDLDHI